MGKKEIIAKVASNLGKTFFSTYEDAVLKKWIEEFIKPILDSAGYETVKGCIENNILIWDYLPPELKGETIEQARAHQGIVVPRLIVSEFIKALQLGAPEYASLFEANRPYCGSLLRKFKEELEA